MWTDLDKQVDILLFVLVQQQVRQSVSKPHLPSQVGNPVLGFHCIGLSISCCDAGGHLAVSWLRPDLV